MSPLLQFPEAKGRVQDGFRPRERISAGYSDNCGFRASGIGSLRAPVFVFPVRLHFHIRRSISGNVQMFMENMRDTRSGDLCG
jgi:hypothetical protein